MKLLKYALVAFAALSFSACETDAPAQDLPPASNRLHQTAMGFTPWPSDLTEAGVDRTYEFIHQHANLITHHFDGGVPWEEALKGERFPKHLREDWELRRSRTPEAFKSFVAVTPLDFDRTGLALAWTKDGDNKPLSSDWASRALDDDRVKSAYLSYVERVIDYFEPDYLAIGIEANIMVSKTPKNWEAFLSLNEYIYTAIKTKHPNLPLFTTVQYEHLRGIEDESKKHAGKQRASVKTLMAHSDLMAISTYRFGHFHPNPMSADFFDVAENFGKPVAIAEFGAMSSPVKIFGARLPADEAGQSRFVAGILDYATRKQVPFVVNWVAIDFDPMIEKLPAPMDEIAKAWVHTGLQKADGRNKRALQIWDGYITTYQTP